MFVYYVINVTRTAEWELKRGSRPQFIACYVKMLLLRLLTPDGARCDMFCSQSTMLVGLPIHCTSFYIPVKCMLSVLGYQPLSFTGFQVITASSTNSVFGHHRQLSYVHHQHFATYHASSRDGPFTLLNDYLRCNCLPWLWRCIHVIQSIVGLTMPWFLDISTNFAKTYSLRNAILCKTFG